MRRILDRLVCFLRGHEWGYFESVPRGDSRYCFRCELDQDVDWEVAYFERGRKRWTVKW